jgi:hypothetical protein
MISRITRNASGQQVIQDMETPKLSRPGQGHQAILIVIGQTTPCRGDSLDIRQLPPANGIEKSHLALAHVLITWF